MHPQPKWCRLSVPGVGCFVGFGLRSFQPNRMCLNGLLDNEGIWCERRTRRSSWNTSDSDCIPHASVTLPAIPCPGSGTCTAHGTNSPAQTPASHRHNVDQTAQHRQLGEGEVARAPHPCWYFAWRAGCHFLQPQFFPCAVNHLQTGFNLVPWGCRHLKARQASKQGSY